MTPIWISRSHPRTRRWAGVRDRLRARGLRWTPQRADPDRGPVACRRSRDRGRARRALPGDRRRDDPVDRVPDAGRPRGARAAAPQPRRRRPRGVPRPARRHPRPPALHRLWRRRGRSTPTRRRPWCPRSSAGATSRSTSATSRSPAAARPAWPPGRTAERGPGQANSDPPMTPSGRACRAARRSSRRRPAGCTPPAARRRAASGPSTNPRSRSRWKQTNSRPWSSWPAPSKPRL